MTGYGVNNPKRNSSLKTNGSMSKNLPNPEHTPAKGDGFILVSFLFMFFFKRFRKIRIKYFPY